MTNESGRIITAPWNDEQIAYLAALQKVESFHGYTCGNHSDTRLLATRDGWVCPIDGCDYKQNWFNRPRGGYGTIRER